MAKEILRAAEFELVLSDSIPHDRTDNSEAGRSNRIRVVGFYTGNLSQVSLNGGKQNVIFTCCSCLHFATGPLPIYLRPYTLMPRQIDTDYVFCSCFLLNKFLTISSFQLIWSRSQRNFKSSI